MSGEIHISGVDRLPITATREKTAEGYLKATAAITCVGVQDYTERQLGGTTDDVVGVYRPHEVVFHPDTIKSAKMKPLTHDHPSMDVTAANYKDLVVGNLGETVEAIDGKRLGASIIVNDADAVKKVERGLVETSAGYDAVLVKESGSFEGRDYQYIFKGPMVINHLAIVDAGRCGPTVKILDKKGKIMDEKELKKFLVDAGVLSADGKAIGMTDGKHQENDDVVSKLIDALPKLVEAMAVKADDEKGDEKDKTDNLGKKKKKKGDEEEEDEKDEKDNFGKKDEAIRDAAAKRSSLIVDASPFLTKECDVHSMTDREILESALKDAVSDIDKKDDAYLRGALDVIVKDRKDASDSFPMGGNKDSASSNGLIGGPVSGLAARKLNKKG